MEVIFAKKCKVFERWGSAPDPQNSPPSLPVAYFKVCDDIFDVFLAEVEFSRTHFEVFGLGLNSSKIALSSARGQHYFLNCLNFVDRLKNSLEKVFLWRSPEKNFEDLFFGDRLKKFFENLFLENTCVFVLGLLPRAFLAFAVAPTPPLVFRLLVIIRYFDSI